MPRDVLEGFDYRIVGQAAPLELIQDRLCQRVATPCLRCTRQTEELIFLGADSDNVGHPWLTLGQRARLVEADRLDLGDLFKRNRLLN